MGGDVSDELLVLLGGPEPSLHLLLVAAGVMSHVFEICVLLLGVLRYSAVWLVGGLSLLCLET